ncbi:2-hydroxyisoflavanone dehydratase [Bienertia sinuspersici]
MATTNKQVKVELPNMIRVYTDGSIERLWGPPTVPATLDDPETGVSSKDIMLCPTTNLTARVYLPKLTQPNKRLPIALYFHGGGFCLKSAFSSTEHRYMNHLSADAQVIIISVEYRLAPEHPLPAAYEDGAGANIAHNVTIKATAKIRGAYICHPFFLGPKRVGVRPREHDVGINKEKGFHVWEFVYPGAGPHHHMINPTAEGGPSLKGLGCEKVVVITGEKDDIGDWGVLYYKALKESGFSGSVDLLEVKGEGHSFQVFDPTSHNAKLVIQCYNIYCNIAYTNNLQHLPKMASTTTKQVKIELPNTLRLYTDGTVDRLWGPPTVPATLDDPETGVSSKDITLCPTTNLTARLYLPKLSQTDANKKLPIAVYFHGGGFCLKSAFSSTEHRYMNHLSADAQVIMVSVEYRLAPEHPLPAAYEDGYTTLDALSSINEPWLINHADFNEIYVGGDSAGANIAHNVAMRATNHKLNTSNSSNNNNNNNNNSSNSNSNSNSNNNNISNSNSNNNNSNNNSNNSNSNSSNNNNNSNGGVKIRGMYICHPFFLGPKRVGSRPVEHDVGFNKEKAYAMWEFAYPGAGPHHHMINPLVEDGPSLKGLGCEKVLVVIGEKDDISDWGVLYFDGLKESGFSGSVELFEVKGEGHSFQVFDPNSDNAKLMIQRLASFFHE